MIGRPSTFVSGFFVGALASGAAALLFAHQPGGEPRTRAGAKTRAVPRTAGKAMQRYMDELGSWSGEGIKIAKAAPQAPAEAPMGWY